MSVAEELGLEGDIGGLLAQAESRWDEWGRLHPSLGQLAGLDVLRVWLRTADPAEVDDVLLGLATLAALDGGDDAAAAAVLAWALLPGARTMANRLRNLTPRIDEVVAARAVGGGSHLPVAPSAEGGRLGVAGNPERGAARMWRRSRGAAIRPHVARHRLDPPDSREGIGVYDRADKFATQTASEELLDVLDSACEQSVISDKDRTLLLCLVEAADRIDITRVGRGHSGIMANRVSEAIASQRGISARTVRRRALRSLEALSSAYRHNDLRVSA
ncbi:MAG: hypothetical protein WKF73_07515 [Nocardioidaceae bacterium]